MKIEYETNIMASQPRYFDTVFLNLDTKKFESKSRLLNCRFNHFKTKI